MKNLMMRRAADGQKKRRKKSCWHKLAISLAAIVVCSMTYATASSTAATGSGCQIPEHTHDESCYTQVEAASQRTPICSKAKLNVHKHTSACKKSEEAYLCGYADFIVHQHNESCYDGNNSLWCKLPVIRTHTHNEGCYTQPDPSTVHQHTNDCYAWERGALICGQVEQAGHTHSNEKCYTLTTTLVCQIAESDGHQHDTSCYDEAGNVICGVEQNEEAHIHGDDCYEVTHTLTCAIPEGAEHHHSDACYEKAQGALICTESTEPAAPTLVCTRDEIILHEHKASCFDAQGSLTCGKRQVLEHKHSEACFETVNEVVKTLTCGMEEHIHTKDCGVSETEEPTVSPTEEPTANPTEEPTVNPTEEPTANPTEEPTAIPTEEPTAIPTEEPTVNPTEEPTANPTEEPTPNPTEEPTPNPTEEPTPNPTEEPTPNPTEEPTVIPTEEPTAIPTEEPTPNPTEEPTAIPTEEPTASPTEEPTAIPTEEPTPNPTEEPTAIPTEEPTPNPTEEPTAIPTEEPTVNPTEEPSPVPTEEPTAAPTGEPTVSPAADIITTSTDMNTEEAVFPTLTIPADWPVMGNAYASSVPMRRAAARANVQRSTEAPASRATPMDITEYIETAQLFYRTSASEEWQLVTESTNLPGTAELHLEINYNNVNIDALLSSNCQLTYQLPEVMRNPSVQGKITSGNTDVGVITAEGRTVTLTFNPTWLNSQKTQTNSIIHGDFYVDSEIDLSSVPGDGHVSLIIGSVNIAMNFGEDIIARYAQLDIEKSDPVFSSDASGDYLTYTLTISAGADGAPDVKVTDAFTEHGSWIESYVGVTTTETSTSGNSSADVGPVENLPDGNSAGTVKMENGSMVWTIGNMNPNETRTLTYKVKLNDSYTQSGSTEVITNAATPYSGEYSRDPDTSQFAPHLHASITKQSANFVPDANGGGTITYTVWVHADANNAYPLKNVKIVDALDGSLQGSYPNPTEEKYLPYLSYDETSFHLYEGGVEDQNGHDGLTEEIDGRTPTVSDTNHSFTREIDSLQPGESKTLVYTVKVDKGVFSTAGNADIQINNRAVLCANDPVQSLNGFNAHHTIGKKMWSRKLPGVKQDAELTIQTPGEAYDATGSSISPMTNPGSFTVPAGSYQYQIVANEAGDWDISSASMTDVLSGAHMQFVGYVRVDAYTINGNAPSSDLTDQEAINNLKARTPVKTVWVHADNGISFSFKPQDIGLGSGKYAYLLTYYAEPVSMDGITQVVVSNTFSLEGILGAYLLTGIEATASVTVEGSNSFGADKMSWYYEKPQENPGQYTNGALYWIIKVDGNVIPKGTFLRDKAVAVNGKTHYLYDDSVVGVYTGNLGDRAATEYDDVDELLNSGLMNSVDSYSIDRADNATLTIKLLENVTLHSGESLYVIVKTNPSDLPWGIRDTMTFKNKLESSYDGSNWVSYPEATKVLCGSNGIFKELNRVIHWDGTNWTLVDANWSFTHDDLLYDQMAPGTYIIWHAQANYLGDLNGRYRFEETIPEGMELAYVSHYWYGPDYGSHTPQIVDAAPGDGWERHETTKNNVHCIYYTKGRQAIWDVDGLVAGGKPDGYGAEFQIACRVTDPSVLLGSTTKDFTNQIKLYKASGKEAGICTSTISVGKTTLTKTGNYNAETNGGRYPFIITLNPLGEDLSAAGNSITLVDELSDSLMLDTTSIRVTNTKTSETVPGWTLSVEGQTFKLVLPDNLPLTINYETVVNAPPEQPVAIVNRAHWEGYSYTDGTSVENAHFEYKVGGTVGSKTAPSVKVLKRDQNNTSKPLAGAEFTLQKGDYVDGVFSANGPLWTGVTDGDGMVILGVNDIDTMEYNAIYCLTETKAPQGYMLDSTPHYIAVAKKVPNANGIEAYPTFPTGVQVWYQSAQMTLQAYNHRGEITVSKSFKGEDGTQTNPIPGTYTFGLYSTSTPSGEPLKTVRITIEQDGSGTGTAVFKDLELDKTYYVFELDDKGSPIKQNGKGVIARKLYRVTYAGPNQGDVHAAANGQTITVTNQSQTAPELPHTGGAGTMLYTLSGLLAMACASAWLLIQHKKRQKE